MVKRSKVTACATVLAVSLVIAPASARAQSTARAASTVADLSTTLENAARLVGPAVVEIFTTSYTAGDGVVPRTADLVTTQRASGSGVLVDAEGYIITTGGLAGYNGKINQIVNPEPDQGYFDFGDGDDDPVCPACGCDPCWCEIRDARAQLRHEMGADYAERYGSIEEARNELTCSRCGQCAPCRCWPEHIRRDIAAFMARTAPRE